MIRDLKGAVKMMRASKWRSFMTMTGIILGIVSVVTTMSLGEGIKRQVVGQIASQGSDLITIRPGSLLDRDETGDISAIRSFEKLRFPSGSLNDQDLELVNTTPGVGGLAPLYAVDSGFSYDKETYSEGVLIGTTAEFPAIIGKEMAYGSFFDERDKDRKVAVVGKKVAEELFKENVPIGRSVSIRGREFVIKGVIDEFSSPILSLNPDFNRTVYIPYKQAQQLESGMQLAEILVRPVPAVSSEELIDSLNTRLLQAHNNLSDFTILGQDDALKVISIVVDLFARFIIGIATLALLIGGIGIMNIMSVLVGERTREIGIRKAVGATNRQIASQFFAEALVLSVVGGLIGIGLAGLINAGLIAATHLQPVITWPMIAIASGVSLVIGIVFGSVPAVRAARKDPIESLRHE